MDFKNLKEVTLLHMSRRKDISVGFIKFSWDHTLWHKDKFLSILELWFLQAVPSIIHISLKVCILISSKLNFLPQFLMLAFNLTFTHF